MSSSSSSGENVHGNPNLQCDVKGRNGLEEYFKGGLRDFDGKAECQRVTPEQMRGRAPQAYGTACANTCRHDRAWCLGEAVGLDGCSRRLI